MNFQINLSLCQRLKERRITIVIYIACVLCFVIEERQHMRRDLVGQKNRLEGLIWKALIASVGL